MILFWAGSERKVLGYAGECVERRRKILGDVVKRREEYKRLRRCRLLEG